MADNGRVVGEKGAFARSVRLTLCCALLLLFPPTAFSQDFTSVQIPMSDGINLDARLFLPDESIHGSGPWGTVLIRSAHPLDTPLGLRRDPSFTDQGLAVVHQSLRGTSDSEGEFRWFFDDGWGENQDSVDTLGWIRAQSWSNGKIGLVGRSTNGMVQYWAAGSAQTGIDAMYTQVGATNLYQDLFFTNGAPRRQMLISWAQFSGFAGKDFVDSEVRARPVYDDEFWGFLNTLPRLPEATVPTVHRTGWYDVFANGIIEGFQVMQRSGNAAASQQRLIVEAYGHGFPSEGVDAWEAANEAGTFPLSQDSPASYEVEQAWMAAHLQGDGSAVSDEPPVSYFVLGSVDELPGGAGNSWRWSNTWPPPGRAETFYLATDRAVGTEPGSATSSISYRYDPANPVPTTGGANLFVNSRGPADQRPVETRADVISFTTDVFDRPREFAGEIVVEVYVSTSAVDTDFSASLTNVYPDGRSLLIADSLVPLRHRNTTRRVDLATPGEVYKLRISLGHSAFAIDAGHALRLNISSSNYPRFEVNPNTGATPNRTTPTVSATNTLHVSETRISRLILNETTPTSSFRVY